MYPLWKLMIPILKMRKIEAQVGDMIKPETQRP